MYKCNTYIHTHSDIHGRAIHTHTHRDTHTHTHTHTHTQNLKKNQTVGTHNSRISPSGLSFVKCLFWCKYKLKRLFWFDLIWLLCVCEWMNVCFVYVCILSYICVCVCVVSIRLSKMCVCVCVCVSLCACEWKKDSALVCSTSTLSLT